MSPVVAPHAGAWIETLYGRCPSEKDKSSHPMRVRGLKLQQSHRSGAASLVAPHAGAWIETDALLLNAERLGSHPMRVRGLKHRQIVNISFIKCRTPCGCVD